jgi:tetratricopeptide (TPR) repeat protein
MGHTFFVFLFSLVVHTVSHAQYNYYKKGVEDYLANNFPQSVQQLTTYLERTDLITDKKIQREAYYVRALANYRLQNYSSAIQDFERTLLLDHPNQGNIHWFLGNACGYQGDWKQAINEYTIALRQLESESKSTSELLVSRGNAFLKIDELSQALADFNKALELNPAETRAQDALAQLDKSYKAGAGVSEKVTEPVSLSFPPKKTGEKRCALVIGNADFILYSREQKSANLLDKALEMSSLLKKSGFEVQLITNASYRQMRDALEQFNNQFTSPQAFDYFVFYYAGEVIEFESDHFLLPSKAELEYEEDITRICFAVHSRVKKMLADVNAKNRVYVVESATQTPKIWFE